MSDDKDKPLELRDQLALSILNGMMSSGTGYIKWLIEHSSYNISEHPNYQDSFEKHSAHLIRLAYYLADQMRKIRLTAFE
jgi:hypothetical protein